MFIKLFMVVRKLQFPLLYLWRNEVFWAASYLSHCFMYWNVAAQLLLPQQWFLILDTPDILDTQDASRKSDPSGSPESATGVLQHLGDFPQKLSQHCHSLYDYAPVPPVTSRAER
ncbi:UNVERIFIED_CONTAM: DnaJ subfamily C GRV2 [Sesamum indicum]